MTFGEGSRDEERGPGNKRFDPRTSSLGPRPFWRSGFTLVEMIVVIVIISLAAMMVLPLLPSTDAANLRSSARSLAAVIRYLGDRSVTTKAPYRLELGVTDARIRVMQIVNGEEVTPADPFLAGRFLADGITIEDVESPRLGKLDAGEVRVDFGSSGLGDLVIIHLKGTGDRRFTITALPQGGKVEVREGYQELKP